MFKLGFAIFLVIAGCSMQPIDLGLDDTGPSARLYDDGTVLRITGCPGDALLGCNQPTSADAMHATVGGQVLDVPQSSDGEIGDQILGLFSDGPFQLTTDVPADGAVELAIDGGEAAAELPPGFSVSGPTGPVSRSAGPITITHAVLDGGTTTALIWSTCGAQTFEQLATEDGTPGQLAIDLSQEVPVGTSGPCTHEIHVDQTVTATDGDFPVAIVRIESYEVASQP